MCKRILVVDDDLGILDVLEDILEYSGYEVNTMSRADHLFEKIAEYNPDLILLDVMLAGVDGREICRHIKQKGDTVNIPVIMISASHDLSQCMKQQGAPNDFVAKPFDIDHLLNKIEHQLAA